MLRTLTITTAATDLQLLTIAEMRAAAGVSDNSQDVQLTAMGLKIAADIATECNIAVGSGAPPTLRRETLTEVVRGAYADLLFLSRRHEITITSIVEDGTTLDAEDYLIEPESGILHRLCDDLPIGWCADKVTVVYAAGFDTIPSDLNDAATDFFRSAWQAKDRDPLVKGLREDVPGVYEKETSYWVGSIPGQSNEGAVPDTIDGKLKRFRNTGVA
jgi:hypothetical protein